MTIPYRIARLLLRYPAVHIRRRFLQDGSVQQRRHRQISFMR
jgi:hypothetical protein